MAPSIGTIGIWIGHDDADAELARAVERLGYGTLWLGSSPGGDLGIVDTLLDATEELVVATGIVNIWQSSARSVAEAYGRIAGKHPGRFLLGIGVGHPEATSDYTRPYAALVRYLDTLDAAGVPRDDRALAALGPKVLKLAADRTAGAHPYLTTPEHTLRARELLGAGPLLAPEQKVVLETDPAVARELARDKIENPYLHLSNYLTNLRRFGFTDSDFADRGSDRLIDALTGWGTPRAAAARIREHLDAGADHVAIQLLTPPGGDRIDGYARLAAELT